MEKTKYVWFSYLEFWIWISSPIRHSAPLMFTTPKPLQSLQVLLWERRSHSGEELFRIKLGFILSGQSSCETLLQFSVLLLWARHTLHQRDSLKKWQVWACWSSERGDAGTDTCEGRQSEDRATRFTSGRSQTVTDTQLKILYEFLSFTPTRRCPVASFPLLCSSLIKSCRPEVAAVDTWDRTRVWAMIWESLKYSQWNQKQLFWLRARRGGGDTTRMTRGVERAGEWTITPSSSWRMCQSGGDGVLITEEMSRCGWVAHPNNKKKKKTQSCWRHIHCGPEIETEWKKSVLPAKICDNYPILAPRRQAPQLQHPESNEPIELVR